MQIKVDKQKNSQFTFEVEVPQETVNKAFTRAFKKLAKEVKVPGFRKGKVPRKIFEQRYGKDSIKEEAINQLFSVVYNKVLEKKKITPLTYPQVEVVKFSENEPAVIKIEVAARPEVKIGSYKGVKIKSKKIEVEEEEVNQALEDIRKRQAEYPPLLENRPTQEGDWLALEVQPTSTAGLSPLKPKKEDMWYKLGSDQLPPAFHKELLGSNVEDEKIVETVLPSDHPQKELAGKKLSLNVKVKEIRKEKLPEANDDFAKKLNFENLDELKKQLRQSLERQKKRQEQERVKTGIVEKVVKGSKLEVPPMLIQEGVKERKKQLEDELKEKKIDKTSFLKQQKLTEDKLEERINQQVEMELKALLVLDKVAQEENIKVTEQEVDERLQLLAKQQQDKKVTADELKQRLTKAGKLGSIIQRIKNEKVINFLYDKAEISGGLLSSLKQKSK